MVCKCGSSRIARVNGKCSDLCFVTIFADDEQKEHDGYVPSDMNIGGGDYIEIEFCLDCGQISGEFPLSPTELEVGDKEYEGY